jgi:RNA methyltransferase, TrmH family
VSDVGPVLTGVRSDRVRAIRRLARRAERQRAGLFVVEGPQAVREALAARTAGGQSVREVLVTVGAAERYADELALAGSLGIRPVRVDAEVMAALSDTVTPQGLLAVCALVDRPLDQVLELACASPRVRLAVLAQVRDPGNAGTVLRAADATGAGAVVLSSGSVDVHNPKVVRSTAGSLFHLPVTQDVPLPDVISALHSHGVSVLAADVAGGQDLDELLDAAAAEPGAVLNGPTAWLFGNEAWGLPPEHLALADAVVRVPLHGAAESLNLAMAATICLYASARAQTAGSRQGVRSRQGAAASRGTR